MTQNWANAAKSHTAGEAGRSLHSHFPDRSKCGPKRPSLALGGWGHTGKVKLFTLFSVSVLRCFASKMLGPLGFREGNSCSLAVIKIGVFKGGEERELEPPIPPSC